MTLCGGMMAVGPGFLSTPPNSNSIALLLPLSLGMLLMPPYHHHHHQFIKKPHVRPSDACAYIIRTSEINLLEWRAVTRHWLEWPSGTTFSNWSCFCPLWKCNWKWKLFKAEVRWVLDLCQQVSTVTIVCLRKPNMSTSYVVDSIIDTDWYWSLVLIIGHWSTSTLGPRAFCSSGPSSWNALPRQLRVPAISINIFRQSLKTYLFNCD